jgi:hypothetical protein
MKITGAKLLAGLMLAGFVFSTMPAFALDVRQQTYRDLKPLEKMPTAQVGKYFAGRTFVFKASQLSGKVRNTLPISGVAILYLAPDGKLLGWSDKSANVEAGIWHVYNANGNVAYPENQLCIGFPEGKGGEACLRLFAPVSYLPESTAGNPFGLKGEKPAPFNLGRFGVTLQSVAKKLGL